MGNERVDLREGVDDGIGPVGACQRPVGEYMQAAMDVVLPYLHERKQFNQPIGSFGLMQGKVADMYVALQSSRAFSYRVATMLDQGRGRAARKDAAACILYASECAVKVALEAIQTLGGNGYINDYPTGRLLRDAKLYDIGAGTNEIRRCSSVASFLVRAPDPATQ